MAKDKLNNLVVENAEIAFRNFSGKEGKFNPAGNRNFCVFFDFETGKALEADGWKVRWLKPRDEGEDPKPYIQVAVSYNNRPPKVVLVSSRGKSVLDEHDINILDWAEIENIDLTITPYHWTVNGNSGVKAYLKSMWVTLVEDEFESKYYDVPDSASDIIGGCGHCDACDGTCGCHVN